MPHLQNLEVQWVSLVDRAAVRDPDAPTEPQRFLLFKKESGASTPTGGDMPTIEELSAELQKAQSERDEALAKLEKAEQQLAEQPAQPEQPQQLDKSELPAPVREALEKAERERDELKKAADDALAMAKAERDTRVEREFIAKAERDYTSLPVNSAEIGPVLKRASEQLSSEDYDALTGLLKAADATLSSNNVLLREIGRAGDPAPASNDLTAEMTRKAEELRKADPTMSRSEAMEAAMRAPEMQARYLATR